MTERTGTSKSSVLHIDPPPDDLVEPDATGSSIPFLTALTSDNGAGRVHPSWWAYRGLLRRLAIRAVRSRYSHTVLGIYWALINPLLMTGIMALVFGPMLHVTRTGGAFVLFMFAGLMVWNLLANSIGDVVTSVTSYAMLLSKVRFPREVLPLSAVLARLVDFACSLVVLLALVFFFKVPVTFAWLWIIPIAMVTLVLASGLAMAVAALNVIYRDVSRIVSLVLLVWFYLCPIFYDIAQVTEPYRSWMMGNPMTALIVGLRAVVMDGTPPDVASLLLAGGISLVVLGAGTWVFRVFDPQFAEIL